MDLDKGTYYLGSLIEADGEGGGVRIDAIRAVWIPIEG
jgi:hypothetical protein